MTFSLYKWGQCLENIEVNFSGNLEHSRNRIVISLMFYATYMGSILAYVCIRAITVYCGMQ